MNWLIPRTYVPDLRVLVETFGTSAVPEADIAAAVERVFGLRPAQIVEALDLLRPVYEPTSAYGHFGRRKKRDLETFTWERTDKAVELRDAV